MGHFGPKLFCCPGVMKMYKNGREHRLRNSAKWAILAQIFFLPGVMKMYKNSKGAFLEQFFKMGHFDPKCFGTLGL